MEDNGFKNLVFSLLWAMICSWLTLRLFIFLEAHFHFSQIAFAPKIIDFIHGYGFSVKKVLFVLITIVYLLTGVHRLFGGLLKYLLGFMYIAFFAAIGIAVIYYVFIWLTGCL